MSYELSIETGVMCASNEQWSTQFVGGDPKLPADQRPIYTVEFTYSPMGECQYDYRCNCPGWKYHRKCRHVAAVKHQRCAWNWEMSTGEYRADCPRCGGPTVAFKVGV